MVFQYFFLHLNLVGDFNTFETYDRQIGSSPLHLWGENIKTCFKPQLVNDWSSLRLFFLGILEAHILLRDYNDYGIYIICLPLCDQKMCFVCLFGPEENTAPPPTNE